YKKEHLKPGDMQVNRDTERTPDSPIGESHAFTVTAGELERQLGFASRIGYTSHYATTLLAKDARPRPYDIAGLSGPYLHAGPGDQFRSSLLSRSCVDVRSLSGEDGRGLRSGTDRLFD